MEIEYHPRQVIGGRFSIEEVDESLRELSKKSGQLLAIKERGQVPGFSAEKEFYKEIYPKFEDLFNEFRAKGILESYI